MSLGDHLRELRRRLFTGGLAVLLGGVAGWFLYDPVFALLQRPIRDIAGEGHREAILNFANVSSSFDLKMRIAFFIGLFISSPVWLYQVWAFVVPGLKKSEKRYALGFVTPAFVLFLAGAYMAWALMPSVVRMLTSFTPEGAANIIDAQIYLNFVMRLSILLGLAFVSPVLLVALDMIGVLTARQILKAWRVVVFVIFLIAALIAPGGDVTSMLLVTLPMLVLYAAAIAICLWLDRRKTARRAAETAALDAEIAAYDGNRNQPSQP